MRTHSGLVTIERIEDSGVRLKINVAEIGHPQPLLIELGPHEWSQLLAHPNAPQACMVIIRDGQGPGKVG